MIVNENRKKKKSMTGFNSQKHIIDNDFIDYLFNFICKKLIFNNIVSKNIHRSYCDHFYPKVTILLRLEA